MGTAIGDAMGMPAYFFPEKTWERLGWIDDLLDAPPDHEVHKGNVRGKVTDDTEQAIYLALAYIEGNGITVEGVAKKLTEWYLASGGDQNQFIGPSSAKALKEILAGKNPRETGLFGETNGCVMRISPVGIVNGGNMERAIQDAVISCTPTHFTTVAVSAAAAAAAAIAEAMTDCPTVESVIAAAKQGAEEGKKYGRLVITPSISRRIDLAVEIAASGKEVKEKLQDLYNLIGTGLAAAEIVPAALGIFAMAAGDPVKTVIYAANASGDADTLGAIAGGIAGAFAGIDGFKGRWVETVSAANPQFNFKEVAKELLKVAENRVY